ncbi:recombinase RecT, partial [Streptomyces sp. NRRL F-2664]
MVIQGIVGYQGIIELIYRAGAVSSVIVETVHEHDTFSYVPGRDERPVHEIDWFGTDRGPLVGVYAYAVMKDGATSKVVVLNRSQVMEAKAKSDGANGKYPQYSPWNTNEEAMWLKTAARRLAKWVPTSAEYMR